MVWTWLIIHSNPFSIPQKPGFSPLNICIVTLGIVYWLFLLTTWTWTLDPIGSNYLSGAKKRKKLKETRFVYLIFIIEVLVVEKMCTCQVFNISLGMQCCCGFRTWLTNSHFSSKDKSRVFLHPSPTPFLILFFLPLWQSYITIWDLSATLMHYSIIKWHSYYRKDDGPVPKALWIKQLST